MSRSDLFDYCLVGGGLQAGLIATALHFRQPELRVLVVERQHGLCGNHTWSCHQTDILASSRIWFEHIPRTVWSDYRVRFGKFQRVVPLGYQSIRSEAFRDFLYQLAGRSGSQLRIATGTQVMDLNSQEIELFNGQKIAARCVIDCRGPSLKRSTTGQGFQKFFGWEVQLNSSWSESRPCLMDVPTNQQDGFRFTYVLPFTDRQLLLQDTYFSDTAEMDYKSSAEQLHAYLHQHGQTSYQVTREEHGCLPMPFGSSMPEHSRGDSLPAGYRGGWFHAATGYSLPLAIQFADAIADVPIRDIQRTVAALRKRHRWRCHFAGFLNRLLFRLVPPTSRHEIFHRFYKSLPLALISRFYAHDFSQLDALRMLVGRPPSGLMWNRWFESYQGEQ
jgi:lycopene beta-cyclase